MIDLNHQPKFHEKVTAIVDAALQAENAGHEKRRYLGGSRLGVSCERALQFEYVDAPVDVGAEFPGRTLRIFEVGHALEDLAIRCLLLAGFDRYRRPLWLRPHAARAWQAMRRAASADHIALEAISGYRSHEYQLGIFERKLARGQDMAQILEVNAAPGFSEHHGGDALDIGTPGQPPAEESFEATAAFAWLVANAGTHGFTLSYPRDNPHGIVYEPWHWRYRACA